VEADDQREGYTELLAVHDFEKDNGLNGLEHEYAKSRPWRNELLKLVEKRDSKRFELFHEFGATDYRRPPAVSGTKYRGSDLLAARRTQRWPCGRVL
jgi:hypothetical protein